MISILTLTYRERADPLKSCVDSVFKHTKEDYEYIVIANDPSQQTRDLLKSYSQLPGVNFTYKISEQNVGTSARNLALDIAKGDFIVNIDDDVIIQGDDYIDRMRKYFADDVAAVGPQGARFDPKGEAGFFGKQCYRAGQYVDFITSWICMFRKGPWRYDPNMFSLRDESDLMCQMKQQGWRLRQSECNAIHNCRRDYKLGSQTFDKDTKYFVEKWKDVPMKWEL